jgi:uncharacterized membrane protein YdbT with pleckstrin-like domain
MARQKMGVCSQCEIKYVLKQLKDFAGELLICESCEKVVAEKIKAQAVSTPASQPQVVVKSNEGCFMQTLNFGCQSVFIGIILFLVLAFIGLLIS